MFVSAQELREKSFDQLEQELTRLEHDHLAMRQQAHSNSAEREDVREAKKNVARCKTVMREKKLEMLVEEHKGKTVLPKHLRPRLTKALRMALRPEQKNRKTKSQRIHARKYPRRIFSYSE